MKEPLPPCKDCQDRSAECHATCERYEAFAKEREQWRQEKYETHMKNIRPIWSHTQFNQRIVRNKNVKKWRQ